MAVSPASVTTAVRTTIIKTRRQGGVKTRATELTTILCVTKKGVYAREAVFTARREPKSDSTVNKGTDTGKGRGRKRAEEQTTKTWATGKAPSTRESRDEREVA
jgi:hypothetical protein